MNECVKHTHLCIVESDNRYSLFKYSVLNKQTIAAIVAMLRYTAVYHLSNSDYKATIAKLFSGNGM